MSGSGSRSTRGTRSTRSTRSSYSSSSSSSHWETKGEEIPEVLDYTEIEASLADATPAGGSTGAVKIFYDGLPFIYKSGKAENVVNEFVGFKLYKAAGGRVPRVHLVVNGAAGGIPQAVLIQFIPGVTVTEYLKMAGTTLGDVTTLYAAIKDDFLLHVLFANWDSKNSDNHMIPTTRLGEYLVRSPYSIDMGGALFYRVSGEPKPPRFFTSLDINEINEIPLISSETRSKLFSSPDAQDLSKYVHLYYNIASRLSRLDQAGLFAELQRLQTLLDGKLFDYYPVGKANLQRNLEGRLVLLNDFVNKGRMRESISAAIIRSEKGTAASGHAYRTNINMGNRYNAIGDAMFGLISASMREEIFKKLQLHGLRSLVDYGGITTEDRERILLHPPPVTTRYRYGGGAAGGYSSWNDDSSPDENTPTPYPSPTITMTLDKTPAAEQLKHKMLAMREDPELQPWLEAQNAFIQSGLTRRERNILMSYTRHGDRLANNYLRRTLRTDLKDLMDSIIEGPSEYDHYSVPLAYSLLDQINTLMREKKHLLKIPDDWVGDTRKPSDLLLGGGDDGNDVSMEAVATFMDANRPFFESARQIESLLAQYVRDIYEIMKKAPRAPHTFTVFRGFKDDKYLSGLNFRAVDFLSTSLSPNPVSEHFLYTVQDDRIKRTYQGSLYEMEVRQNVPCIYMESISQYVGEYEILLPPGVIVETDNKVHIKYFPKPAPNSLDVMILKSGPTGDGSFVGVVECTVRLPRKGEHKDQLVALGDMRVRDPVRDVSERFSADKPRGERAGRGHKKRITWKAERRAERLRKTRRVGSGSSSRF